jgi:hypothetical protein
MWNKGLCKREPLFSSWSLWAKGFTVYKDHNYKAVQCDSNKTGSELYDLFGKAHIESTIFCPVTWCPNTLKK